MDTVWMGKLNQQGGGGSGGGPLNPTQCRNLLRCQLCPNRFSLDAFAPTRLLSVGREREAENAYTTRKVCYQARTLREPRR